MGRLNTAGLLFLFLLSAAGVAYAQACPEYGDSHAVVVGINRYGAGIPTLTSARSDAQRMAAVLRQRGFQVVELLDGAATKQAILEAVGDQLRQKTRPNDRVVVYFAGHGRTVGDASDPLGYLIPADGHPKNPVSTGISMKEMADLLRLYPARHRLFIADACYSGLAVGNARNIRALDTQGPPLYCAGLAEEATGVLVAGRRGEQAFETETGGLFTTAVLKALTGRTKHSDDGLLTADELAAFVKQEVSAQAYSRFRRVQVPQWSPGTGGGIFIFETPKRAPLAMPERQADPFDVTGTASAPDFQYPVTVALGVTSVVGVALGLTFWRLLEGANQEAEDAQDRGSRADFDAAKDDADLFFGLQMGSYALAGVGAVGAIVSYFVERPGDGPQAVQWQVGPGFVGLQGRF